MENEEENRIPRSECILLIDKRITIPRSMKMIRRDLITNQYSYTYIANSSIPKEWSTVGRLGREWHVVNFFCLGQYSDKTVQVSSFIVSPPVWNKIHYYF